LDTVVWALHLAGSTDQAFTGVDSLGFSFDDFEDANWTSVFACTASITIVVVNLYFRHDLSTSLPRLSRLNGK
jgi:hypothetical protein